MSLTVGSLFAGIGGFDLGFERAGFEIKWQVEIDPFCRAVLAKHWPKVKRYEDVQECCGSLLRADASGRCAECGRRDWLPYVDCIVGGFPCQDISVAGFARGLDGERSGLWGEFRRLVGELRPSYVVVENSAALTTRGLGRILGDLASVGFDAEWSCFTACSMGASHVRRRMLIVAYPHSQQRAVRFRDLVERPEALQGDDDFAGARVSWRARMADPSALYRGAHGLPNRMDRCHAVGNAVVPQIAEWIARQIMKAESLAPPGPPVEPS